jgi:hypothetical protein
MVGAVVYRKLVLLSVDRELAFADAVTVTSHKGAEERLGIVVDVIFNAVVCLNYISVIAITVGYHDTKDCASVVGDGDFTTFVVLENVKSGFFTFYALFEIGGFEPRKVSFAATHIFNFIAFGYCLCGRGIHICPITQLFCK